jgi:hypothetical protein
MLKNIIIKGIVMPAPPTPPALPKILVKNITPFPMKYYELGGHIKGVKELVVLSYEV